MISKELLSEVLKEEVNESIILDGYIIKYSYKYLGYAEINIFELEHKCKEWAIDNGYYLTIYNDRIDVVLQKSCKMVENITDGSLKYDPMLVFKACQWILDNKDK